MCIIFAMNYEIEYDTKSEQPNYKLYTARHHEIIKNCINILNINEELSHAVVFNAFNRTGDAIHCKILIQYIEGDYSFA